MCIFVNNFIESDKREKNHIKNEIVFIFNDDLKNDFHDFSIHFIFVYILS